jgi:tRNA threonylcarbamoyladenosine biosynthesis protein TsaE
VKELEFLTGSAEETEEAGARLGRLLKPGDVVALSGPLGAGKTVFVKGLARGLGIDPKIPVTSPTFILVHEYPGPVPLYHFDFYRLARAEDVAGVGFDDYLEADGVCAIEWADKFPGLFGGDAVRITFALASESSRRIALEARPEVLDRWGR